MGNGRRLKADNLSGPMVATKELALSAADSYVYGFVTFEGLPWPLAPGKSKPMEFPPPQGVATAPAIPNLHYRRVCTSNITSPLGVETNHHQLSTTFREDLCGLPRQPPDSSNFGSAQGLPP